MRALIDDYQSVEVSARQRAMLSYAAKLTSTPGLIVAYDLESMRESGLTDRDILDVNQVVAYFAYVNRVADGLGVVTDGYAQAAFKSLMGD